MDVGCGGVRTPLSIESGPDFGCRHIRCAGNLFNDVGGIFQPLSPLTVIGDVVLSLVACAFQLGIHLLLIDTKQLADTVVAVQFKQRSFDGVFRDGFDGVGYVFRNTQRFQRGGEAMPRTSELLQEFVVKTV